MKAVPFPAAHARPRTVSILGSTGSVGQSTVDLLMGHRDKFRVRALTAHQNVPLLAKQARELGAEVAVIADEARYAALKEALAGSGTRAEAGAQAVVAAAGLAADWIMAAIVGAAGMEATLCAIRQGTTVALANKESLVCAGPFMMEAVRKHGATLLPVDSEHNAVFQVWGAHDPRHILRVILTASGGPFLRKTRAELAAITPAEAVRHPTWAMGAKISVDSATMVNKSLEIIEASYLFNLPDEKIDVLIHPQSIVHSMVEYLDGSVLSQMGAPDMRTPIAHTLGWPARLQTTGARLNLVDNFNLSFEQIDLKRFPAVTMARQALRAEPGAPVVFNAANEVAVAAFLAGSLKFSAIESVLEEALQRAYIQPISSLQGVFELDREARRITETVIAAMR